MDITVTASKELKQEMMISLTTILIISVTFSTSERTEPRITL
jgi:hypothetical protein